MRGWGVRKLKTRRAKADSKQPPPIGDFYKTHHNSFGLFSVTLWKGEGATAPVCTRTGLALLCACCRPLAPQCMWPGSCERNERADSRASKHYLINAGETVVSAQSRGSSADDHKKGEAGTHYP